VSKKNNIIEINGKRYDARTGDLLDATPATAAKTVRNIDGVHAAPHARPAAKATAQQPVHDTVRPAAKTARKHRPQPSRTLMRHAVKKPAASVKTHHKTVAPLDRLAPQPLASLQTKASVHRIDDKRLQKAKSVPQSQAIKRFDTAPVHHLTGAAMAPLVATHSAQPLVPRPQPVAPSRAQTTSDLLQRALEQATSHEEPRLSKRQRGLVRSRRITSVSAVTLSVFVLLGVVVYQNMTNIRLQFASAKAGFAVSLPNKQPAGYHLSHLTYQNGLAAFNFTSNTDSRAYALIEKASPWNSQALREGYVATITKDYQTIEAGGRTVYLYGQQNATWVSSGVWYQVQTSGSLSTRQLVDLASSL